MTELALSASRARTSATRWLGERFDDISFRRRLLGMALRRLDNIPAEVVMALEAPGYDIAWPSDCGPTDVGPGSEVPRVTKSSDSGVPRS